MGWNRASIGRELNQADFSFVDAFVPRCAMCCGLCGKLRFIICWSYGRVMSQTICCFLPLKAAAVCRKARDSYDDMLL